MITAARNILSNTKFGNKLDVVPIESELINPAIAKQINEL
jgi:hypothetical protein